MLNVSFAILMMGLLLLGCASYGGQQTPQNPPAQQPPAPSPQPAPQQPVKEFTITAKQFAFEPATIEVNEGDFVRLKIKSMDVPHGFGIQEFNVNEQNIKPGEDRTVEFVASKAGTYPFVCMTVCGAGHTEMRGTLIVHPKQ